MYVKIGVDLRFVVLNNIIYWYGFIVLIIYKLILFLSEDVKNYRCK